MMDEHDDPYVDAARWLQEAGRRARNVPAPPREAEAAPRQGNETGRARLVGTKVLLSGVLALAYLQYYFLDVMVQINALPAIIVFYGQPAPGFGGAHAPIGGGVLEMVMPIAGRSAHAASSRIDATSASRIVAVSEIRG
jgi:hypothetical protein